MTKDQLEALLGRPLTSVEVTNRVLYLKIAQEALEELLCTDLCNDSGERTFDAREGYSTVFVDPFTAIDEVKVGGNVVTNYSKRQWDKRSGTWYNSLVFDCQFSKDTEVTITADWGFSTMPSDLQLVLAGLFDLITKKNKSVAGLASKQVEDFRISFHADVDLDADFGKKYASIISKYSLCNIGNIKHGGVC